MKNAAVDKEVCRFFFYIDLSSKNRYNKTSGTLTSLEVTTMKRKKLPKRTRQSLLKENSQEKLIDKIEMQAKEIARLEKRNAQLKRSNDELKKEQTNLARDLEKQIIARVEKTADYNELQLTTEQLEEALMVEKRSKDGLKSLFKKQFLDLTAQMKEQDDRYRAQIRRLREQVGIDDMTGFCTKKEFKKQVKLLLKQRNIESGCLAFFDLNNFKKVNDAWGHKTGDEVIVFFTEFLRRHSREGDVWGRYGGDEFVGFFSELTVDEAIQIFAARQHEYEEELFRKYPKLKGETGFSFGCKYGNIKNLDELMDQADAKMFINKRKGSVQNS